MSLRSLIPAVTQTGLPLSHVTANDLQNLARWSINPEKYMQDRRTQELKQFTEQLTEKIKRDPHSGHSQDLLFLQRQVKPQVPTQSSKQSFASVDSLLNLQLHATRAIPKT